jgi:hypothetical protein
MRQENRLDELRECRNLHLIFDANFTFGELSLASVLNLASNGFI